MVLKKGRDPVNSGLALQAFRDQGFSAESSICEIIDNSIQANADEIRIKFEWRPKEFGEKIRRVGKFVFIDDGDGMDKETLFACLVLGEGTRRIAMKGIGKFGVGATFSGISQAKRIQVFSKENKGKWLWTQLDLDLLEVGEGIAEPEIRNPPAEYAKYTEEHGTIVLWDKVDRSDFNENEIEDLKSNIGRIYRKFLTKKKLEDEKIIENKNPIKIIIQDENVEPYDPLFITYNPKKDDKEIPKWESKTVPLKKGNLKSQMVITISKFPESWWDTDNAGNKTENTQDRKITADNQGVTLVREGREILWGEIPYFKFKGASGTSTSFDFLDRWTGIEISFNRDADQIFGVQNNKSRLLMSNYAREKIESEIRDAVIQRRLDIKSKRGEKSEKEGKSRPTSFVPSKKKIQEIIKQEDYTDTEKSELRKFAERMADKKSGDDEDDYYNDLVKGYHPENSFELDSKGPFVSYEYVLNSIVVKYNLNHPFMEKFFNTLKEMAKKRGEEPDNALNIEEIKTIKILFDILLASLGLSKKRFPDLSAEEEIESTINTLITNWGDISYRLSKEKLSSDN